MAVVGYIPFDPSRDSAEAGWVADAFGCQMRLAAGLPNLNRAPPERPPAPPATMARLLAPLLPLRSVIAEGPAGFAWAALLRRHGFTGGVTILPYLNPRRWSDVAATAVYRRFRDPRDRIFLGSTPSARIYRRLGVDVLVGEPYGIDDRLFRPRPNASAVRERFAIPRGPLLVFAGRAQPDKDLYRLLRAALKAKILFPDLQTAIASHVVDGPYVDAARREMGRESGVHFILEPEREELAALYSEADVFATASTSCFETFGRAPAEALACGTPAIAPRYDGFSEVLDQPGGRLVDVELGEAGPQANEASLLRAIYDVLSRPRCESREAIAAAARRRFARSRTIRLLAHVVSAQPGPAPAAELAPADLALPQPWQAAALSLAQMEPADALQQLWEGPQNEVLSEHGLAFVEAVRRSLCTGLPSEAKEAVA